MNNKILILGGAGFIGRHTIRYLLENTQFNVNSIGRGEVEIANSRFSHINTNISNESLNMHIENPEDIIAIVNCAGGGDVQKAHLEPLADFSKTVSSLAEVLEFLRCKAPKAKFVQLSSAAVYGNCFKLPIEISSPLNPKSTYGHHNLIAENLIKLYADIYNIEASILRVFSVYGPDLKKQILWDASNKLSLGESTFFGTGQEIRDFIYIDDLVETIFQATQLANHTVPIYNCGSGNGTTIKELLNEVATYFDGVSEVSFSGKPKTGDPIGYIADISNSPAISKTALEIGIKKYMQWFFTKNG